jgi:DNA-binding CsgD family transcriptional regulator
MPLPGASFVGRVPELAKLRATLDDASAGKGHAIVLTGESGIGKSRLTAQVAAIAATSGLRVLRGRTSELGAAVPLRPITEVLLSLGRYGAVPATAQLLPYQRALSHLVPEWRDEAWPGSADSPVVLAEAVLRLVAHVGHPDGCLVTLEDLHNADLETLAVVEYLADNLAGLPVMLLATMRVQPGPAADLVQSARQRNAATVLELGRLTDQEVATLAARCLDVTVTQVPAAVLTRVQQDCAGNPFLIEELLRDMLSSGALAAPAPGRWRVVGEIPARVPASIVRNVARRAETLGEQGLAVLRCAAVLGRRFPLDVVQRMVGVTEHDLLRHLRAAVAAQLVTPDEQAAGWYAFRHSLTAEAVLDELSPATRTDLAGAAADIVAELQPGLPGQWCLLSAQLRQAAGHDLTAGQLLLTAGRQALADSAAGSAVAMLEQAQGLLASGGDPGSHADVLEALPMALLETGQIDRALALAERLDAADGKLTPARRCALHAQLGWVAAMAGRTADATAQLAAARHLVDIDEPRLIASIDMLAAYLALESRQPDGLSVAEELAHRCAAIAERVPLPVLACQAWQLLGTVARSRGLAEADASFQRMDVIAHEHNMTTWRLRAMAFQAGNHALAHGDVGRLVQARDAAMQAGAIAFGYGIGANLALMTVLLADWNSAQALAEDCWSAAVRLRFDEIARFAAVARAALAAHQGRRAEMELALSDFRRWHGQDSSQAPLTLGLCQAVCALLEEDLAAARAALEHGAERERSVPTVFQLTSRHGLHLLVQALCGRLELPACRRALDEPPTQIRWNLHFARLAHAVLLGRAGHREEAVAEVEAARLIAAPFDMARHLGARLVAEAALADSWASPVSWLLEAEQYFYQQRVRATALACRALLRRAGARVNQRRDGCDRIPQRLRRAGVTAREYDVLELVVRRWGNQEVGRALHISPRTVEKHVASLIAKTGLAHRAALIKQLAGDVDPRADLQP